MYRMYLEHRKFGNVQTTVQVQKKKTNKQRLTNQKLSEILLFWKYR